MIRLDHFTAGPIGHIRLTTPLGSLALGWGPPGWGAFVRRRSAGVSLGRVRVWLSREVR